MSELRNETTVKSFEQLVPEFKNMLAYFRVYPDKFLDYISDSTTKIKLYPFQRIWLRVIFRYRMTYITATRGSSKSFTSILALYLRAMMYPNIKLTLIAPQKQQAAAITQANIESIWSFYPILQNEVKSFTFGKDYTRLVFHNDSTLDVTAVAQGSRGLRKHGIAFEEICQMDAHRDNIAEVILPMLANNRNTKHGIDPNEIHKTQTFVTTAATKQAYAWEKLAETLMLMQEGKSAFVLGNSFELPVLHDQLDINYINELRESPTFNPMSFAREYGSEYTGTSNNSMVKQEDLEKCRVLKVPELKATKEKDVQYIISYDVARSEKGASSAMCVFKIKPRGDGSYIKHLVNVESFTGMDFRSQSIYLKEMVEKYKAAQLVIDGNGLGVGLIDFLIQEVSHHPPYSVTNDSSYDKYRKPNSIPMIFIIRSNSKETKASDIHNLFMTSIANQDVKMLYSEFQARGDIKRKDPTELAEILIPFVYTDRLVDEVLNLEVHQQGTNTVVKRISGAIQKDRFSAMQYGLFYVYLMERRNMQRKRETIIDSSKMFAFKAPSY
ncbi:DNA-packaging protein [Bacillus cereus]|uniref:DNA-packaging protein n=1 Tax=Bacillus thuringiensis TaxID=1428 RepID=A0AB36VEL9_BACTU|nr:MULTISPECIES: DNA-packaging protein [Bacillus cereus group]MEB9467788.1 DNA-packaging protein [Bacillus cereus]MEC0031194.1 DNA-packaging protein [Bacillus cereus]OUA16674.1 DNA-packaging protein [Bacillus thuringiensis serovar aizawai]PDZ55822.1 DNA-packaging protein [Bacillus cereus]PES54517.1 DNA-packaging protein [Bacillus thuringiensis]